MLRIVPSTLEYYNKYLLNERMNLIQLLNYWIARSTFNEDGESERKGSNEKRINEFCVGLT